MVEGDLAAIEAYKSSGGDIARQLTADEVQLLNRSSAFDVGFTLVHLAIRFQRQDMLAILLTEVSVRIDAVCLGHPAGIKAIPSSLSKWTQKCIISLCNRFSHISAHEHTKPQNQ